VTVCYVNSSISRSVLVKRPAADSCGPWRTDGRSGATLLGVAAKRPEIRARLTPEARAAWDRVCGRHGVTLTTLVQALGERLDAGDDEWITPDVVDRARQLDRERYSRRR